MKKNRLVLITPKVEDPKETLELQAKDMHKSKHISLIDACKCTGNCEEMN